MKLNESEIMEKIAYRIGTGNFISSDVLLGVCAGMYGCIVPNCRELLYFVKLRC